MNDRVMQFRVGVMVLATAIIAGILIVLFGDLPSLVQASYPLKLSFTDARGVSDGTPVRKNGILVGRVSKVQLDERGGVSVVADIDSYVPIYKDEQPRIVTTLLGDAEIQLVAGRIAPLARQRASAAVVAAGRHRPVCRSERRRSVPLRSSPCAGEPGPPRNASPARPARLFQS